MEEYYAYVRRLLRDEEPRAGEARGASEIYRTLVRRQQRQVLLLMFGPLKQRLGSAGFEPWLDALREQSPPRDANPSRWALAAAHVLGTLPHVDGCTAAIATYLALRAETAIAEDPREGDPLAPGARLATFSCDPRRGHDAPTACGGGGPLVLAFYRDVDRRVRTEALSLPAVAAWGVLAGEVAPAELALRGVQRATLQRGEHQLRALGALPGAGPRSARGCDEPR